MDLCLVYNSRHLTVWIVVGSLESISILTWLLKYVSTIYHWYHITSVVAIAVMHDLMMLSPTPIFVSSPFDQAGLVIMSVHMFRVQTSHCSCSFALPTV